MSLTLSSPLAPDQILHLAGILIEGNKLQVATELIALVTDPFPQSLPGRLVGAELALAKGEPDDALETVRDILQIDPLNPRAHLLAMRAGDAPDLPEYELGLAISHLAESDRDCQDIQALARQLGLRPERSLAAAGFMYLAHGRLLLAERYLQAAMRVWNRPQLALAIAQIQLETFRMNGALETCRDLGAHFPTCLPADLIAAQANAELGMLDKARSLLDRTSRLDPGFERARQIYARLPVSRIEPPPPPLLVVPEILLNSVRRILEPDERRVELASPPPEPSAEFVPPSERFLPLAPAANNDGNVNPDAAADQMPKPASLPALIAEGDWTKVWSVLEYTHDLVDDQLLAAVPAERLQRLGDELTRLGRSDLAEAAYRRGQAAASDLPNT